MTKPFEELTAKPPTEAVIHERCQHALVGLTKGQRCPECGRGTLYKYPPGGGDTDQRPTPPTSTQHFLERLRCNTCGAYFTAELPEAAQQDGPAEQTYGYSARALMAIQKYFAGAPFYRQQTLQQLFGMPARPGAVGIATASVSSATLPPGDGAAP
jgi:transposase